MKKLIKRMETMEESLRSARLRNENLSAQVRSSNLVKQQMQRLNRDLETQVQNSALRRDAEGIGVLLVCGYTVRGKR